MQSLSFFFLQTGATPSAIGSLLPLVLIAAIFYFLVFRPMQRQKKDQAAMLSGLQSGNEVVTTGGIMGTVVSVTDDTLVIRVKPDNVKLMVARSAVASVVTPGAAAQKG